MGGSLFCLSGCWGFCRGSLFFPVEGFELCLRIAPRRFAGGVDQERSPHHDDTADDEYREPYGIAAGRDLRRRNETQDEGEQRAAETTRSERLETVGFEQPKHREDGELWEKNTSRSDKEEGIE